MNQSIENLVIFVTNMILFLQFSNRHMKNIGNNVKNTVSTSNALINIRSLPDPNTPVLSYGSQSMVRHVLAKHVYMMNEFFLLNSLCIQLDRTLDLCMNFILLFYQKLVINWC